MGIQHHRKPPRDSLSPGSKTKAFEDSPAHKYSEDPDISAELLFAEELLSSERGVRPDTSWTEGVVESDSDEEPTMVPVECDVRLRGYDTEFWRPFLEDEFGGSNAADVMCTPEDDHTSKGMGSGSKERNVLGRKEVMCTTNDAFDHRVVFYNTPDGLPPMDGTKTEYPSSGKSTWTGNYASTSMDGVTDPGDVGLTRKLEDIDDAEFDIPPLFDDTKYEREALPDLDIDESDDRIYVGKIYISKEDCQIGLAIYAIKNMFYFKQTKTKRHYFVLSCTEERCDWRILAREMREGGYYEIKKATLEHSCCIDTRSNFKKKASSRIIAAVFKSKFGDPSNGPKAMDLQSLVLQELRISASYMKCYRAIDKATIEVRGTYDESFLKISEYLYTLKLANPGTVYDLATETDEEGKDRFLYLFLAFGASIVGFKHLRRVLVLDGTHLGGKFKGVLLTASGQDANFQVFPLAYAVVDSENDASWTWFLQKLERIIADNMHLTILSDRHKSIIKARKIVFPLAQHGACIVHLQRNITARFKSKGLAKMVGKAAFAFQIGDFKDWFNKIKSTDQQCAKYLEDMGTAHWSRAYFRGERYNLMTSNIAETLNKALRRGRSSPILELLMFIQSMMTRWFSARRKKSLSHRGKVTPEVDKQITKNLAHAKGTQINMVSPWNVQVVGLFGQNHLVHLRDLKCSCKEYDKIKIPCGHALFAGDKLGLSYGTLAGEFYRTSTWVATYQGVINPERDARNEDIPEEIKNFVLLPPHTRRPSGRPKESRIPSTGEIPRTKTPRPTANRCGRCKGVGHNWASCKNPI